MWARHDPVFHRGTQQRRWTEIEIRPGKCAERHKFSLFALPPAHGAEYEFLFYRAQNFSLSAFTDLFAGEAHYQITMIISVPIRRITMTFKLLL